MVASTDLKLRPGLLVSDTLPAQNGGRMAYTQVVTGVKNNLFPDISAADAAAGCTRWRKAFWHIDHDSTTPLNNVMVYLRRLTQADDYLLIQPASATGTEATDANTAELYGVGALVEPVVAGDTGMIVECEHADYATLQPYRVGMLVRLSDIPLNGGAGNEDFVRLDGVDYAGATATLTFTQPLAHDYAADALVSGVIEIPAVAGALINPVVASAAGGFTAGNCSVPSRGAISEAWTITFTSATAFSAAGAVTGALSAIGSVYADFQPINPNTGTPYWAVASTAWSGTFQAGDTVTFATTPASVPLLIRQRVPAGSASFAGNVGSITIRGEVSQ